jgi:hypothetical protein
MDVHVPAAVTRGLLLRGIDVLTAQMDGTTQLDDSGLMDRPQNLGVCFSVRTTTCWWRLRNVNGAGSFSAV